MKISLKLCLAVVALAFFGAAIGMFGLSFLDQVTSGTRDSVTTSWGTGFDIFKSENLDAGNKLGTIFAFVFICIGALAACYAVFYALTAKKSKKSKGNAKLICAFCTFVVCALVPAILLFLTKQTTGVELEINAGIFGGTKTTLGIGAILAAVFSVLGGVSLSAAELR